MKSLNEAYSVLHDDAIRSEYDAERQRPASVSAAIRSAPAAREVGIYGQLLSALLCMFSGFMLLLLVRFNGLWFLWPLAILAFGVMLFGVFMTHSAVTRGRASLHASHPVRRFRAAQEIMFWSIVFGAVYGLYLILTTF